MTISLTFYAGASAGFLKWSMLIRNGKTQTNSARLPALRKRALFCSITALTD
jgi:hypothetical protein